MSLPSCFTCDEEIHDEADWFPDCFNLTNWGHNVNAGNWSHMHQVQQGRVQCGYITVTLRKIGS